MAFERVDLGDITLFRGDCLEVMQTLEAGSVDAILTDIPYGTTRCAWDEIIPLEPMWLGIKHVLKPKGVFVTTASQPFTSKLVMSNLDWFRDEIIWIKNRASRHLDANKRVLKAHENILLFCGGVGTYNPQMIRGVKHGRNHVVSKEHSDVYSKYDGLPIYYSDEYYPQSVLVGISNVNNKQIHPTQKPVALYEYLTRTYTNEGDMVLDFTMGSGTTLVACVQTGRRGVGIEKDQKHFDVAVQRIKEAQDILQGK